MRSDLQDSGCPVGIEETQPFSASLQLWPNPAQGAVNITSVQPFQSITFKDITGKIVLSEKKSNQRMQASNRR
ncbi:MAG: T9SS type A sorting domain-containing protein [Rheinheimera sp.]|nr:T9SS type A sorting domain-containing protein [Rheinheimera sp.]